MTELFFVLTYRMYQAGVIAAAISVELKACLQLHFIAEDQKVSLVRLIKQAGDIDEQMLEAGSYRNLHGGAYALLQGEYTEIKNVLLDLQSAVPHILTKAIHLCDEALHWLDGTFDSKVPLPQLKK